MESCVRMAAFLAYAPATRRSAGRMRIASALLALVCGSCGSCDRGAPHPNVLIFVVDTWRADAFGASSPSAPPTPAFDALARGGVRFDQATSPSSWTRASIATLWTGVAPPAHGAIGRRDRLPADLPTLAERLGAQLGGETEFRGQPRLIYRHRDLRTTQINPSNRTEKELTCQS